jgi:hypothetical protein
MSEKFVQEHAYVEDYYILEKMYRERTEVKKQKDEEERGWVEIDLNHET